MGNELSIELREQINKLVKDLIEEKAARFHFHLHTAVYATTAAYATWEKLLKVPGSNDEGACMVVDELFNNDKYGDVDIWSVLPSLTSLVEEQHNNLEDYYGRIETKADEKYDE